MSTPNGRHTEAAALEATPADARKRRGSDCDTPARILIVDDDMDLRELLQIGLSEKGLNADVVASADEAIALLTAEPFDAVISDLRLKGMDGIELAGRIRAGWPDVPVLLVTAYGSIQSTVAAMRAGAYDVITKPFDFDTLSSLYGARSST